MCDKFYVQSCLFDNDHSIVGVVVLLGFDIL